METNIKLHVQIVVLLLVTASVFVSGHIPFGIIVNVNFCIDDDYGNPTCLEYTAIDTQTDTSESNYPNTVAFYLYTKERGNDPTRLYIGDENSLKLGKFDPKKRTIIIIHGWLNSYKSPACTYVRDAYAQHGDYNIILVDWGTLARNDLLTVCARVLPIAKYVAKLIDFLVSQGMDPSTTILVGHSFGAHMAGLASYYAEQKVGFVVALDPAGPCFQEDNPQTRLSKEDAKCVHVIHTTKGLGLNVAVGHIDFYPNGGEVQVGCIIPQACGHERAYEYFAESINNTFLAHKYGSPDKHKIDERKNHTTARMGGAIPSCNDPGIYILFTNPKTPFAKNSSLKL